MPEYTDSLAFMCTPLCSVYGVRNSESQASVGFVRFSYSRTNQFLFLTMSIHRGNGDLASLDPGTGEIFLQVLWN